jgi:hypothetical protein
VLFPPIIDGGGRFVEEGSKLFSGRTQAAKLDGLEHVFRLELRGPPAFAFLFTAVFLVTSHYAHTCW